MSTRVPLVVGPQQPDLGPELDRLLAELDLGARRAADPIAFPHRWPAGADREVVATFAGLLAYGRADLIARAMADVSARIGDAPAERAASDTAAQARQRFDGFVYRFTRGDDLARLWLGLGALIRAHGTIGAAVKALDTPTSLDLRPLLIDFRQAIIDATPAFLDRRGFRHLLADPAGGSACKRYNMWLRWMVRGPDAIDFGDWSALGTHRLVMPVDTHVHRIARYVGLTDRAQADWRTAVQITEGLRRFDARDPLRYDFALAHLGISGRCPRRRVPAVCVECPIRRICCLPGPHEST